MLERFTKRLVQAGFSIVGAPAIFAVSFRGREGSLEAAIADDGSVAITVGGAPDQDHFQGKDFMELIGIMESTGHAIQPVSGNQYRVNNSGGDLVGEFLIAPHKEENNIVIQACSANLDYKKICEEAGIAVKDFEEEEIKQCLEEEADHKSGGYYSSGCCW